MTVLNCKFYKLFCKYVNIFTVFLKNCSGNQLPVVVFLFVFFCNNNRIFLQSVVQWFLLLLGNLHWPFIPLEHLKYNGVGTKHVFYQKYHSSKEFLEDLHFISHLILENSQYGTNSSWTSQPQCTYQNKQSFTRAKISFPSEGTQQSNVTHVYFIPDQAVSVNITFFFSKLRSACRILKQKNTRSFLIPLQTLLASHPCDI